VLILERTKYKTYM